MQATQITGAQVDPMDALKTDLFALYYDAGRNVRYIAESGEDRAYWPNRYLQALKKAVESGDVEVVAYIRRMVLSDAPSRGFGYLEAANRLDLTVEALVVDPTKPYHHLFDEEMVRAAIERLAEHDYEVDDSSEPARVGNLAAEAVVETEDGFAVELTVEVTRQGYVRLRAGEVSQPVEGTLGAVRTFVGLLAQAHAAATGGAGVE
jgi:hypothetical protein